ncbi:MAG TPA: transposase [Kofleriaceae bacterium]|nr:transposase [Kofleriaceae bacterium]
MGRRRKTHVQQQLRWANAAGDLRGRKREASRGANRRGKHKLGRPKKPGAKQRHAARPRFEKRQALHVTLRVERSIGSLRKRACYAAIRHAAITVFPHADCRIVHLSIQRTHLHLLVEAETSAALSAGMQAFQISAAKQLNAAVSHAGSWWQRRRMEAPPPRRKGRVFADRYHARLITSPMQARRELAYVLNNWRKHGEDRSGLARTWQIDPFATGWSFDGWRERGDAPFAWKVRDTYDPIPVYLPRTWLLREGWRRRGLISTHEVPSAPAAH